MVGDRTDRGPQRAITNGSGSFGRSAGRPRPAAAAQLRQNEASETVGRPSERSSEIHILFASKMTTNGTKAETGAIDRYPPPERCREIQLHKLNEVLAVAKKRPFYANRLGDVSLPLESLERLSELPLLSKDDLLCEQRGRPAKIFDAAPGDYIRMHQTSGSKGWPMPIRDTAADWRWWIDCWQYVLDAAEVTAADVAMMAFSFGPFIGFWTANDALVHRGALVVPGGGMSSEARLRMIQDHRCTVVCCTPTYALHLAGVAIENGIDLAASSVRVVIVAGEPGGSVPAVRGRIESTWGARVVDHSGASEVGAWGFGDADGQGLHVIETEFIAERLRFDEAHLLGTPADDGDEAELVLTNLGRHGGPAIRYRTGDMVRGFRHHDLPCPFLWLRGGVLGRADDMLIVRGVNVFPSSVEAVIREVEPSGEYRVTVTRREQMDQLKVEIETTPEKVRALAGHLRDRLAMRIEAVAADAGSLPRFEAKARRWIDNRQEST